MAKKDKKLEALFTEQDADEKTATATLDPAPEKKKETDNFKDLVVFVWERMVKKCGFTMTPAETQLTDQGVIVLKNGRSKNIDWGILITKDKEEVDFFRKNKYNRGNGWDGRTMEAFCEAKGTDREFILRHVYELGTRIELIHGKLKQFRKAMSDK